MKEGPLSEKELQWLEDMLEKYGSEASIIDVSELDGLLTAIFQPLQLFFGQWAFFHAVASRAFQNLARR